VDPQLFRCKNIDQLISDSEHPDKRLKKTLGWISLTALGIGAIIGTGIFILTGTAAAGEEVLVPSLLKAPVLDVILHGRHALGAAGRPGAGPAIAVSFLMVAIVCGFAGLCYAELASMIPIAGSAYTYTYATMGELVAWIIGWDLILEYAVSNMAVAVGFSAYVNSLLNSFGIHLPDTLSTPAYQPAIGWLPHFNLVGFLIVMLLTVLLITGIKESAASNSIMVGVKLVAIFVFIVFASKYINPINWVPFAPNGFQGILTGGAIVFFSYIGFIQPFHIFKGDAAPVATALHNIGLDKLQRWVTIGALMGMISSLLVYQYGQARVWFAMSRDGLLPSAFCKVHPRFRTPHFATWIAGIVVGIPAGIFDIGTLADLSNIGTLFAFVLVAAAVLVLRKTQPDRARGFKVPLVPLLPILSIVTCVLLMASLTLENWIRFFVWLIIGLVIYFAYSRHRSTLNPASRS
jgi:basic amino acid/polyamine antiporter, APA family